MGIVHIALSQFIKVETKYHVRLQELKGINKWSIDIAFIFRLYITKKKILKKFSRFVVGFELIFLKFNYFKKMIYNSI